MYVFSLLQFTIYYLSEIPETQIEEYKASIDAKLVKIYFRKTEVWQLVVYRVLPFSPPLCSVFLLTMMMMAIMKDLSKL